MSHTINNFGHTAAPSAGGGGGGISGPPVPINEGGTNATSYTSGTLIYYDGTKFASSPLFRESADIVAQRRTTNAQESQVYNTYTSGTDHERLVLKWDTNVARFMTEKGSGGGTARVLALGTDGTNRLVLAATSGVVGFGALTSGVPALKPSSTTLQVRLGDDSANTVLESSALVVDAAGTLTFTDRSKIASAANGNLSLTNNAGTDFGLLRFGGTAATFPALKRSTTTLQARLADDSDFAPFSACIYTATVGTVTADTPAFSSTATWNNAGVAFTHLKANVTDTASAAASTLMDMQVGGTSVSKMGKAGGFGANAAYVFTSGGFNVYTSLANALTAATGGAAFRTQAMVNGHYFSCATGEVRWSSSAFGAADVTGNIDVVIGRDAANTLFLRNGTNAQAFNVYNTYTSGSVFERGFFRFVSNVLEIGTEHTGATARDVQFKRDGTLKFSLTSAGSITIPSSGTVGVSSSADIFFDATQTGIRCAANVYLICDSNNNDTTAGIVFGNNNTAFGSANELGRWSENGLLSWAGVTSSFPAIKRSGVILQARLADDSGFGFYQGKLQTDANAVSETITPTHTLTLYDAAGTAYKVAVQAA